jgi:hypothetical protein
VYNFLVFYTSPLASLEFYPRGKFVLLSHGEDLHLILGPVNEFPYHANLVYEYLVGQRRAEATMTDGSHCRVISPGWEILGGGQYRLDDLTHTVHFSEKSTAYGKYPQSKLAENASQLLSSVELPGWDLQLD